MSKTKFIELLRKFNADLKEASDDGTLDELPLDIHPDKINAVCDSVAELIKELGDGPGDQLEARDIHGRQQCFFKLEDIEWALDVHVKDKRGFTKQNTTAVILVGNEDAPDAVWATQVPSPRINTIFTRLA